MPLKPKKTTPEKTGARYRKALCTPGKTDSCYRDIFEAVNDGIFIHDVRDGRILDANQCALEMYGYTKNEIVHKDVASLSEGVSP